MRARRDLVPVFVQAVRGYLPVLVGAALAFSATGWAYFLTYYSVKTIIERGWLVFGTYALLSLALVLASELFLKAWQYWRPSSPLHPRDAANRVLKIDLLQSLVVVQAFVDSEPCRLATDGVCYAHMATMVDGSGCAVPKARELLTRYDFDKESDD